MADNRQTLLAKLAPVFGVKTENVAVEALGHILSGSEAARRALSDVVGVGGAEVGQIARVRTQATGEERARPDLAGFDGRGDERVLIEAKFWAGLTANQPVSYLERLPDEQPSALLFVAPAARVESLWVELRRRVSESASGIRLDAFHDAEALRSAAAGGARRLMLTSWKNLLDRMAAAAAAAADSHTEVDVRQLRGLAVRQDADAFLPIRQEELGLEFPRRMLGLQLLVDNATDRAVGAGWADVKGLQVRPQFWGYGRYLRLAGAQVWFGIDVVDWASSDATPLWLWFTEASLRREEGTRIALDPLRTRNPPEVFEWDDGLAVPVMLPVGVEYDAVLDAVVARLEEIAQLVGARG